jgi:hypothetical protein
LLSPAELEEYHPEGEGTGFVEKAKYKQSKGRTPTLRLELSQERKTKDGGNGKEPINVLEKQDEAKKKLKAFLKRESKIWKELEDEEVKLGDKDSEALEQDKNFVLHEMSGLAELFLKFGDEYQGRLNAGAEQLYFEICRREGIDEELAEKAWNMALKNSVSNLPKSKKASSIR